MVDDRRVGLTDLGVFCGFARSADHLTGVSRASQADVAAMFAASRNTVRHALDRLIRLGYVEEVRENGHLTGYRLLPPPPVPAWALEPFCSPYRKQKIPRGLATRVMERDLYRCRHCGTHKDLAVDHIHPESLGGTLDFENLQTLCRPCNSRKGVRV